MKTAVPVVLIVCGTILVMTPYIHNVVATSQISELTSLLKTNVSPARELPRYADGVCMLAGIIMVVLGRLSCLCRGREPQENR